MTKVSAVPEYLFRYSDACTKGAEQLQTWVRNVLAPALTAYQNGGGFCQPIDGDIAKQVAAVYYTDRDVRTVGQAFLQAGGVLARGQNQPIFFNNGAIDKVFKQLAKEAAHQGQINAGAALAHGLPTAMNAGERQRGRRELAKHADDGNPEVDSQTLAKVLENPLEYYASKPNSKERTLPTIEDLMNEFSGR
ncbi:hypothetical protein [Streptomyces sp. ME19-01-6]|uniref:hypothetical protein n=1 Tax=Streptomyces sp. ME19-01-6 TaxID=3028686 RepID=UPI0029BF0EAC|nr:hypothetical protein [Streptomyces sp. ME19-01-6]MDX3229023.1 hypothetical protein [Streptomyces sp. ME19-01-6]